MPSCCLESCESYKYTSKQKIGYFKFPINNKSLLKKWLNQIRIPNWYPTESHQICSTHFHVDDIDFSNKYPQLKSNAVPMIFPLKHFQNIYVDNVSDDSEKGTKQKTISNKIETDKMNNLRLIKTSVHTRQRPSPTVLCKPTSAVNSVSQSQINTMLNSNLVTKRVPIKTNYFNNDRINETNLSPYILIVSDNKETGMPFRSSTKRKRAVLRIQIDKKLNTVPFNESNINSLGAQNKLNQNTIKNYQNVSNNNCTEEIEVDDVSSSKVVVFKFDSSTGDITVFKKQKEVRTDMSTEKVDTNKPIANKTFSSNKNFKENCTKVQNNSSELLKNRRVSLEEEKQNLYTVQSVSQKLLNETNESKMNTSKVQISTSNAETSINKKGL